MQHNQEIKLKKFKGQERYLGGALGVRVALQNVSHHGSVTFLHCPVEGSLSILMKNKSFFVLTTTNCINKIPNKIKNIWFNMHSWECSILCCTVHIFMHIKVGLCNNNKKYL